MILQSDRCCHSTSGEYQRFLAGHKLICSMSAVGSSADSATMEGLFSLIKRERANRRTHQTGAEARPDIFDCVEPFRNSRRHRLEAARQKESLLTQSSVETGVNPGGTAGLFVDLSSLSFTPAGTGIVGASLAGVTLDDVDMVDLGNLEPPTNYTDYSPSLGPTITTTVDSVSLSVTFNGTYPGGLHGDQLVWVVDVATQSAPTPGAPVPATLPLFATSLGIMAWSRRRRQRRDQN